METQTSSSLSPALLPLSAGELGVGRGGRESPADCVSRSATFHLTAGTPGVVRRLETAVFTFLLKMWNMISIR